MTYEFENARGHVIEREFPIGQAPPKLVVNGRVFKKIISRAQINIPETFRASWDDERAINRSLNAEMTANIEAKQKGQAALNDRVRQAKGG